MRLGVSAVQHDMKREETVEEVEKNTEWQRRTPKRKAARSNRAGDAKSNTCKPERSLQAFLHGEAGKFGRRGKGICPFVSKQGFGAAIWLTTLEEYHRRKRSCSFAC